MTEWRTLHAYSNSIESLLLTVVGPFLEAHCGNLTHGFWERHYAGGPNVRIRLSALPAELTSLVEQLRADLEDWMRRHPSTPVADYSPERAAMLLRMEGVDPASEQLEYRNDVVIEGIYPEAGKGFASAAARRLAEDFRRARGPIVLDILRAEEPRREAVFKLFLVLALFVGRGRLQPGCVSYKSHWEGFASFSRSPALVERIEVAYRAHRARLHDLLHEVEAAWQDGALEREPALKRWWNVLEQARRRISEVLESGEKLVAGPSTPMEVAAVRERLFARSGRLRTEFVETLWADENFLVAAQRDIHFQRPRALVNFLYDSLAALGINPIEKMAHCHHVFRSVEEVYDCDLNDLLRKYIATVTTRPVASGAG